VPHVGDAGFSRTGPNAWLPADIPLSEAESRFSATAATDGLAACLAAQLAAQLATPKATTLMQLDRTTWFQGNNVTFVRMTFPAGYTLCSGY